MRCGYVQDGVAVRGEGICDEAAMTAFPACFGAEEAGRGAVGEEHKRS